MPDNREILERLFEEGKIGIGIHVPLDACPARPWLRSKESSVMPLALSGHHFDLFSEGLEIQIHAYPKGFETLHSG